MSANQVTEALASKDDKIIKQVRGTEKGRVTRFVDQILRILQISEGISYDLEKISKIEVKETELSLREALKNVQQLHDGYQWYRSEGKDATEEESIEIDQNDYIMKIEDKYRKALALIEKYELACKKGKEEIALAEEIDKKKVLVNDAKETFENAKKTVQNTLNSEDEDVQRTASIVFQDLSESTQIESRRVGTVCYEERCDVHGEGGG